MKNNFIFSHPAPNATSTSTWAKLSPLESSSVYLSVWDICLCPCPRFMFWCSVILAYWNIQHFPGRGEANSGINTLGTRSKTIQQLISCVDPWVFCYVDRIWHKDWNQFSKCRPLQNKLSWTAPVIFVIWRPLIEEAWATTANKTKRRKNYLKVPEAPDKSFGQHTPSVLMITTKNYKQLQTESCWSGKDPVNLISQTVVNGMRSLKASSPVQLLLAVLLISGA